MMPFVPWTHRRHGSLAPELAALAAGDAGAIAPIYRSQSAPVYRYALALCGNAAWAADATQEAFVALAQRPQAYDASKGSLGAYLAGVARHALAAQWRDARLEQPWPDEPDDGSEAMAHMATPEALLVQTQSGAAVWAALRRLSMPFREAVILVDLQERPYAEAAAIAGIELNTLRTRLHRGRTRLAALLQADHGAAS